MNLLIINHNAGRPDLGYMFRPYYLAREWVRLGHSTTIIGSTYSHVRKGITIHGEESYDGIKYLWIKSRKYKGNGFARIIAIIQFITKILCRAKSISERFKPDVVIASSTYPLDIYPTRRIAKYSGAKLCFELHDLWPLSPIELGGYSKRHPFIKVMQMAEDFYCKHADKVISIIPLAKDYLVGRGLDGRKMVRFHAIFLDIPSIKVSQVIQRETSVFEIKIVSDNKLNKYEENLIIDRMISQLGDINVNLVYVDNIPLMTNGKIKPVISLLKNDEQN